MMQAILTMMTNDNDSVAHDYGDDGNDAHHAPPLCPPPPALAGKGPQWGARKARQQAAAMVHNIVGSS